MRERATIAATTLKILAVAAVTGGLHLALPAPLAPLRITGAQAACSDFAQPGVYWRRCRHDGNDLSGQDLTGANIRDASFKRATLRETILVDAEARGAKFVSADLTGADLSGASLVDADFTRAVLQNADLSDTNLYRARFFGADLRGADLSGARMEQVDLWDAKLGGATWTDGKTVCAEGSVGGCTPKRAASNTSAAQGADATSPVN